MRRELEATRGRRVAAPPRRRRFHGDDGSIIAEAALLSPFFFFLMFGMVETGGAYRDYLTVSNAAIAGARTAAIEGNASDADYQIISAIEKGSLAMPSSQILAVVIYKAQPGDTSPSNENSSCLTGSVTGVCNYYSASDVTSIFNSTSETNQPGTSCVLTDDQHSWCPVATTVTSPAQTGRNVVLCSSCTPAALTPDYIGVWIQITHPWITGIFGNSITLTGNAVLQLEPQKLGS
jgi:Flp pilus assembly protein TadG